MSSILKNMVKLLTVFSDLWSDKKKRDIQNSPCRNLWCVKEIKQEFLKMFLPNVQVSVLDVYM